MSSFEKIGAAPTPEVNHQRLVEIRARIKAAMDDPRPGIPAKEVFDRLCAQRVRHD